MPAYIALLRGINVSGQKSVLMEDLRKLCESLKFGNVKTYIQSGNVVFTSPAKAPAALAKTMETAIAKKYGFEVPVVVRSAADLIKAAKANPYAKMKLKEGERLYITFLAEEPSKEGIKRLGQHPSECEECKVSGPEVYLFVRKGYGNTLLSNAYVEKCLGVKATTRNLETTLKLIEMGTAAEA